jgi:V8-like Glu-specific endopeptidase
MNVGRWTLRVALTAVACAAAVAPPFAVGQAGDPYATRANPDTPVPVRHYSMDHTDPQAPPSTLHSERSLGAPEVGVGLTRVSADTLPGSPVVFVNSKHMKCTGWLYGPDIVATAGHCVSDELHHLVWSPQDFWVAGQVTETLWRGLKTDEQCSVVRVYTTQGWVQGADSQYDVGALRLSPSCGLGKARGWLGIKVQQAIESSDARLVGMMLMDMNSSSCTWSFFHRGYVRCDWDVHATPIDHGSFFSYDANTPDGTSGSALVWRPSGANDATRSTENLVIGIHAHVLPLDNGLARRAVRITQDVFDLLMTWSDSKP